MLKRSEVLEKHTWSVKDVFQNQEEIDAIKNKIKEKTKEIVKLKGNLCKTIDNLHIVLTLESEISVNLETLYTYYNQILHQDHTNSKSQSDLLAISNFYHQISNELSFVSVEILKTDKNKLIEFTNHEKLCEYKKQLTELIEQQQYVLGEKEEKIMSLVSDAISCSNEIYSTFTNANLKFNQILDGNNKKLDFSEGDWSKYAVSYDRVLRKNAFECLLTTYGNYSETITMIYISHLKAVKFKTNARNYNNPRQMALFNNQIDEKIYDNLIESVHKNFNTNHRYLALRKKILKVKELHLYDVYVPIIDDVKTKYEYEEGCQLVLDSLSILGQEYQEKIKTAFNERYIDVYPNIGKSNGAYSGGSYNTKPFILLNYTNTLNDIFTLTHELGHSMHTKFTNENQNYQDSHYKIFVAEIASTVNELILFNYLRKNNNDKDVQAYLLNYNLDQFRSTVYRQTMFAEFEAISTKLVFEDQEISKDILSNIYYDLNKKYFGDEIVIDELIANEWLRIPHFYYNFYVYQYATSFCIATKIVKEILSGNQEMKENYLHFLKLGDSIKPIDLIKTLKIDITSSQPLEDALMIYKENLEELEKLLGE